MQIIEQMLIGLLPILEFTQALRTDRLLQDTIRQFVPPDAINDPSHRFWSTIAYSALERHHFDYLEFLFSISRFDGTLGDDLNVFSLIKIAFEYYNPDIKCTTVYHDAHGLYLDAVGTYYEGPEVVPLLQQLVLEAMSISPKTKRIKVLREKLKETFHVTDQNRPHWIQGGEWPMGKNSPMQYIGCTKSKDGISYTFRDVDTNAIRTIDQYY